MVLELGRVMTDNGNPLPKPVLAELDFVEQRLRRIERTIPWLFALIALLGAFLVIIYLIVISRLPKI